ncbi:hypothetical protein ACEUE7_09300 [Micrococcus endophyticus]|uniref:hypothetical protein n=1 Tax=Micrococcus endophyticus TaxID=455343 RepID=UPI0035A81EF4
MWGLFYDDATRSYDLGFTLAPAAAAAVVVLAWLATQRGPKDFHRRIVRAEDPAHPATDVLRTISEPGSRAARIRAVEGRAGEQAGPTLEH